MSGNEPRNSSCSITPTGTPSTSATRHTPEGTVDHAATWAARTAQRGGGGTGGRAGGGTRASGVAGSVVVIPRISRTARPGTSYRVMIRFRRAGEPGEGPRPAATRHRERPGECSESPACSATPGTPYSSANQERSWAQWVTHPAKPGTPGIREASDRVPKGIAPFSPISQT